ncbi:YmdB family metallophosphoesterase [Candidatus Gracilibacteria bacterium]|nr:YmdB family metallophosphoesterase [Candidatus Gracilibacteria bacterium]
MKILAFGDIYGRIGRKAFLEEFPRLVSDYSPDFTIVNVDNITSGRGPIERHAKEILNAGVDVLTGGDHIVDNIKNIGEYLSQADSCLLRPDNIGGVGEFAFPGIGHKVFEKAGKKLLVIHLIGHAFMDKINSSNAFVRADEILDLYKGQSIDAVIVDFHKEATAEIQGLAHYLDGRISAIFGTHTHVQTNDDLILPKGTGLLGDAGMSGPLYSVIGADFNSVKKMFLSGVFKGKIEQSLDSNYLVNGVLFDIDDAGKCRGIEIIKRTGKLI